MTVKNLKKSNKSKELKKNFPSEFEREIKILQQFPQYMYTISTSPTPNIMKFLLLENTFFKKNSFFAYYTTNIVVPYLKKNIKLYRFFSEKNIQMSKVF